MALMDDSLFKLWVDEKIELDEALGKAQDPDGLARRVAAARQNEEEEVFDEDDLEFDD